MTQASLLDWRPTLRIGKASLEAARAAGTAAASACEARAETHGFDREAACAAILEQLAAGPVSGEALVTGCKARGITAHDDRAFGAAFASLSRRKAIRCVGYVERAKGHGTAGGRIWERVH